MHCSVIVPTFRRPADLHRCLTALAAQTRPAMEVLAVVRAEDADSAGVLIRHPFARRVTVGEPGVIAAMNAGLAAATGDIIALTDDDAAPWPDWLERIVKHFVADGGLGGVGGRDWQYKGTPLALDDGHATRAGELQWFGRVIGQHHWAVPGPPRDVAVIKGVNCAYRAAALRAAGGFDTRLAGTGAQVHWELSLGLSLNRASWRIVFDPALGVDHFPATRFDEDQRGTFVALAQQNAVANETRVLLDHFRPVRQLIFLAWALSVGTRASPGIVQAMRLGMVRRPDTWARCLATYRGRWQGVQAAVRGPAKPTKD